jgi:hypothetical protein
MQDRELVLKKYILSISASNSNTKVRLKIYVEGWGVAQW